MRKLFWGMTLIDGKGGKPLENAGILLEDEKIIHIGRAGDFSPEEGVQIMDCREKP